MIDVSRGAGVPFERVWATEAITAESAPAGMK
jgi:hypothetical protein